MDYSVIIPAHNEEDFLPATLKSLAEAMQACPEIGEVIVVDNDSQDRTSELAREAGATVVFEAHRQIARARNAGADRAKGHMLVFLDADTLINAELLQRALRALREERICVGGATIDFHDQDERSYEHLLGRLWNRLAVRFSLAAGCFVFSLAEAHRAVGGFDERYYASEEIWYVRGLKRWGKSRSLGALVITDARVTTSDRKLHMYGRWEMIGLVLVSLLPFALRSRRLCTMWYGDRPKR